MAPPGTLDSISTSGRMATTERNASSMRAADSWPSTGTSTWRAPSSGQ